MVKKKRSETKGPNRPQGSKQDKVNQLCNCCSPTARICIGTKCVGVFVENAIDMKRQLQVRSDANASLRPPGGPDTNADGSGGSKIDEGLFKSQGKVYRTDQYTIYWWAEGFGPLRVTIKLSGAITYQADWLPSEGSLSLAKNHVLKPPDYNSANTTVIGSITVEDCKGQKVHHSQMVKI